MESLAGAGLALLVMGGVAVVMVSAMSSWSRTATVLELDGQATLATEDIRAELRGSQPASIEIVEIDGVAFSRIRYVQGTAFDPVSGEVIWNEERVITVAGPAGGDLDLVLQDPNGATLRRMARAVTAFTAQDASTDSTLAPDEVRISLALARSSLSAPFQHSSVVSTRLGFETVLLMEAEAGAVEANPSWAPCSDAAASGGACIMVTGDTTERRRRYNFSVPSSGRYYLWGRGKVMAGSGVTGPYEFHIDGGSSSYVRWGARFDATWRWHLMDIVNLDADTHTLRLRWQSGSPFSQAVDRILITSKSGFVPSF